MEINLKDIDLFIEENKENILRDIARLVAIPSIEGEPEEDAPFGIEPKKALEKGLEIAYSARFNKKEQIIHRANLVNLVLVFFKILHRFFQGCALLLLLSSHYNKYGQCR